MVTCVKVDPRCHCMWCAKIAAGIMTPEWEANGVPDDLFMRGDRRPALGNRITPIIYNMD